MNKKSLIITGTTKGLGQAMAQAYLDKGLHVIGIARSESSIDHPLYEHYQVDLTDLDALKQTIDSIKNKHNETLYALINNAAQASQNHLLLTPNTSVERMFTINVTAPFLLMKEFAKGISPKKKPGRIINILSPAHKLEISGEGVYAASKAALESLTRSFSLELASSGITVNAMAPSLFSSSLINKIPEEKLDLIRTRMHVKRDTQINDVIKTCDYFLDQENDYITGQVIYLGGLA